MKVLLMLYDECKYWNGVKCKAEAEHDVVKYEVHWHSDDEATKLGFPEIDESGQYLILYLENGDTVEHCNTHVDLYEIG